MAVVNRYKNYRGRMDEPLVWSLSRPDDGNADRHTIGGDRTETIQVIEKSAYDAVVAERDRAQQHEAAFKHWLDDAEDSRDAYKEALRKIVRWDDAEKPHKNLPLLDCADLARDTLGIVR